MANEPNGTIIQEPPEIKVGFSAVSTSSQEGGFLHSSPKVKDGILHMSPSKRPVTDTQDAGLPPLKHSEAPVTNSADVGVLRTSSDKHIGTPQDHLSWGQGEGGTSSCFDTRGEGDQMEHVAKKLKTGGDASIDRRASIDAAIKQTSEIVLVLAGMGQMRAGRSPTEVERGLMAEARRQLGYLAGKLAPKDIISKDGVESLIEDLGLNRLKEQTQIAGPRKSIADRASETMKKIEQARQLATSTGMTSTSAAKTDCLSINATSRGASLAQVAQVVPMKQPVSMVRSATVAQPFVPPSPFVPRAPVTLTASVELRAPAVSTGSLMSRTLVVPTSSIAPISLVALRAPVALTAPVTALAPVTRAEAHAETQPAVVALPATRVMESISEAPQARATQPLLAQKTGMVSEEKSAFVSAEATATATATETAASAFRDLSRGSILLPSKVSPLIQTSSISSVKVGTDTDVPKQIPRKVEVNREVSESCAPSVHLQEKDSKPVSMPIASGNLHKLQVPAQGPKLVESPVIRANHSDIARNVQKILQSMPPDYRQLEPPSKAYMNAPITCQICKIAVTDVDSILVCDSCEKGVHLKCLQSYNQRGIPKGEWHCPKCLVASNGRPLPPKYGRVGKSTAVRRTLPNKSSPQASPVKKLETQVTNSHQPTVVSNGLNTAPEIPIHVDLNHSNNRHMLQETGDMSADLKQNSQVPSAQSRLEAEDGANQPLNEDVLQHNSGGFTALLGSLADNENQCSPKNAVSQLPHQQSTCTINSSGAGHVGSKDSQAKQKSDINMHVMKQPQTLSNSQGADRLQVLQAVNLSGNVLQGTGIQRLSLDSKGFPFSQFSVAGQTSSITGSNIQHEGEDAQRRTSHKMPSIDAKGTDQSKLTEEEDAYRVEWVGDKLQVTDGKTYYQSCCVKGVLYKLHDYALFRPETPNVPPYIARLRVLWEDDDTGSKWVRVNWCYYPNDIPQVVGRPTTPEKDEVYESNHGDNNLVGSIQGPCQVLSSEKYKEEIERRELLKGGHEIGPFHPVFMCKWFYDAPRGVFHPVIR